MSVLGLLWPLNINWFSLNNVSCDNHEKVLCLYLVFSIDNKMTNKKYHTVGTIPKSIIKIIEWGKNDCCLTSSQVCSITAIYLYCDQVSKSIYHMLGKGWYCCGQCMEVLINTSKIDDKWLRYENAALHLATSTTSRVEMLQVAFNVQQRGIPKA